jgi:tetratricopeptide (TPR) repeat protein
VNVAQETALAYRAFAAGNYTEAAERSHRILREFPTDPAALTLTGRLALLSGEPDVAHDVFQKILREHPRNAALWVDLGLALRDLNRHAHALQAMQRAARLDVRDRAIWVRVGEIYLSLNNRKQAADAFRRALDLDPQNIAAFRGLSQAEPLEINSPLVAHFEVLSTAPTLKPAELAQLHYTLADIYRRKGPAAMFIRHLFEANAQQRTSCADARAQYEEMFDRLESVFTRSLFEKLERADPIEPTPLFVLGMPRSGTTLVERLLAAHPNVSAGGELDYMRRRLRRSVERATGRIFPEGMDALDVSQLNEMGRAFAQRLRLIAPGSTHVTDKTPGNYHLLGLLRVLFPVGRIVHVQRDPMDTCFSILQYPFDDRSPHTCDIPLLAYSYARYVRLMRKWEELFAGEFVTVRYEELVADPLPVGRGLYEHCGLEWRDEYARADASGAAVRTFSAIQVRQPIHTNSAGAWREYAEALEPLRSALERELAALR